MMNIKFTRYIKQAERLKLYNLLIDMIEDNIPFYTAMNVVINEGKGVYSSSFIKKITLIASTMKESNSLADAFNGHIPNDELVLIRTAEVSGQLSEGLKTLINLVESNEKIKSILVKALVTPVILFLVVLFVIAGYSVNVFPTFLNVLPITKWPEVTSNLYHFGSYLYNGGIVVIVLFTIALTFVIKTLQPRLFGIVRRVLDKTPLFYYYNRIQTAIFLNTLSALMLNNIPLTDALIIYAKNSSPWMRKHLEKMMHKMKSDSNYKNAFDVGLLSPSSLLVISIYSSLDTFSQTMKKLADKEQLLVINDVEKLASILKQCSTITLACSVIWIFTAIYSLVDKLGSGF
ncbi:MAG: type II secretion system F family protein [Vibrio sp.]